MIINTLNSWAFRDGDRAQVIGSPSCWEDLGLPKDASGPFEYQTAVGPIDFGATDDVLLRFGAVSYDCAILIDGREVGRHRGLWDSFEVDITDAVMPGRQHSLSVRVEKPASLTGGPDSPAVEGRFPTREVLAGFLPYVWGHIHGGIWQPVELAVAARRRITELDISGTHDGIVDLLVTTSCAAAGHVRILNPDGVVIAQQRFDSDPHAQIRMHLPDPRSWSPEQPALYTAQAALDDDDHEPVIRRFGLRTVTDDQQLRLNEVPLYPRMILSWGWYPDRIAPDPGPERVRADLLRLRELGFNGVKLCLWFPPDYYFEIADEVGMLIWLELPLWLPLPTDGFTEQVEQEIDALVRQARQHPSVIIYTLGCELGRAVDPAMLELLYRHVKELAPGALVCDNSGSGEAYGGAEVAFADFYDHHLYAEPEHLREVFDHFAPGWRRPLPWLMGEFCDLDAYRDPPNLTPGGKEPPWWASNNPTVNPQGARWQFDLPELADRLDQQGWLDRSDELIRIGDHAALLHRKLTCEYVRSRPDVSGYVITGERDTPISTSGLIDDHGRLRVEREEFAAFNGNTVLLYSPERRRRWTAGGDRPAPVDPYCHRAGSTVGLRVLISHCGPGRPGTDVSWALTSPSTGAALARGRLTGREGRAGVHEVGHLEVTVPNIAGPVLFVLRGSVTDHTGTTRPVENSWTWWIFPADPWAEVSRIGLYDPSRRFADLATLVDVVPATPESLSAAIPLLASRWTPAVEHFVGVGGHAVVALDLAADSPVPLLHEPFWRESLKVIETHAAWRGFPERGLVETQFGGLATDLAMDWVSPRADTVRIADGLGSLLRRVDARTGITHDYAIHTRIGEGTALFSTLAFEGGRGSQPVGIARNVAGSSLMATWIGLKTCREPTRS